jgi:sugar/nucleoside kinase (ribokinase family)
MDVAPKWIYLTSLGENTVDYQMQIVDFVEKHPETKLAFQPGTFQMKMGKEVLERIYKNTEIFFCNVEEAQRILGETSRDPKTLMKGLASLGPKKSCNAPRNKTCFPAWNVPNENG